MHKLVTLAAVVVLAASSANCARENSSEGSSASLIGPSATEARGGKGGGGGSTGSGGGSLTLVMVADRNGDGLPNWNETVTFNVSTTETTTPNVDLKCSQNGVVVYAATSGFYDSYPWPWTKNMTLSSGAWQGGAANCTATLYYGVRKTVLATLNFTAGA